MAGKHSGGVATRGGVRTRGGGVRTRGGSVPNKRARLTPMLSEPEMDPETEMEHVLSEPEMEHVLPEPEMEHVLPSPPRRSKRIQRAIGKALNGITIDLTEE